MSLRSKLGLSLASLALGAGLACGPKPTVKDKLTMENFCPISSRAELQYEGPTSMGYVRFYGTPVGEGQKSRINYYTACLDTPINGSFYSFNDGDMSGILGDNKEDYVLEVREINGKMTAFASYEVDMTVRYEPFASFRKGEGPLADEAVEQSRRRVTGKFNEMYKTIFQEVFEKVGRSSSN